MKSHDLKTGTVYVCGTPIGNPQDISLHLIDLFKTCTVIAAEDTRVTKALLTHHQLSKDKTWIAIHQHNERRATQKLERYLKQGEDIILVSDAGTPNISDPAAKAVQILIDNQIDVVPIPGPSAVSAALSISGFLADRYVFAGFIPKKDSEKEKWLTELAGSTGPVVFFESPNRIKKTVGWFSQTCPNASLVLLKDMTKTYARVLRGHPDTVLNDLDTLPKLNGEWCGVIENIPFDQDPIPSLKILKKLGLNWTQVRTIATQLLNIPRNQAYEVFHDSD